MSSIEILEERIATLEKQVYGAGKTPPIEATSPENSLVETLVHANKLISSALSGPDKATGIVRRLQELNSYLDSTCEEVDLPIAAKWHLILTLEPEIRENYKLLEKMQSLAYVLEPDRVQNVPELSAKLNELSLSYLESHNKTELSNANVRDLFVKYNAVITSISKTLISLDAAVTAAEIAAAPRKQLD